MKHYAATALGVTAVSFAAIFIRMADAHPTMIAFMRMLLATLVMALVWMLSGSKPPQRADWPYLAASGLFLALHFATWIASLGQTSVASSVVLVATQPLFTVLLSGALLGERISRKQIPGLVVCLGGALVIGLSDIGTGGAVSLRGNLLALSGALFASLYWLAGRKVRRHLDMPPYTTCVYGVAALFLLTMTGFSRIPFGPFTSTTWASFALLAVICTGLGHSSFNFALGGLSASFISVAALGEPLGASLWAALIYREYPTLGQYAGAFLILSGILSFALLGTEKPGALD